LTASVEAIDPAFLALGLAEEEIGARNLRRTMQRVGWAGPPATFLKSVTDAYCQAQRRLKVTQPRLARLAHYVFTDGLAQAGKHIPTGCRVLVLGCGEGFAGVNSSAAAQLVKAAIDGSKIASLQTLDLAIRDLYSPPRELPIDDHFNLVVTNSVLHFIAPLGAVVSRISSSLTEDGLYLMAHEPNARFWSNHVLREEGAAILAEWTDLCKRQQLLGPANYWKKLKRLLAGDTPSIEKLANEYLSASGSVTSSLTGQELARIVDPHRPCGFEDAFRIGLNGLDSINLAALGLQMSPLWIRSYNHLGNTDCTDLPAKWKARYDELENLYPLDGAAWTVLWRATRAA